jgi:hypothetical protein
VAFRVSIQQDGSVKYRSRIVARGFTQIPGADFDATYSPTVQLKTVLCTLRIVTHEDMEMETGDVGNAYLETDIDKEIYMLLPNDLWDDGVPTYVLLNKGLYGLKQSGELRNRLLHKVLHEYGFTRCSCDSCLYVKVLVDGEKLYLLVYVDDLAAAARRRRDIHDFFTYMESKFKITRNGDIK